MQPYLLSLQVTIKCLQCNATLRTGRAYATLFCTSALPQYCGHIGIDYGSADKRKLRICSCGPSQLDIRNSRRRDVLLLVTFCTTVYSRRHVWLTRWTVFLQINFSLTSILQVHQHGFLLLVSEQPVT
jgi:hypothetical protein